MATLPPNPAKYCSHKGAIANLAKVMSSPGYRPGQFRHVHDPSQPGKKSGKKKSRKKRPYSGILSQQMIESRENERQRINEIISQQKKEYEAQMSLSISGNKSGSIIVMKPAPTKDVKTDTFEAKPNLSEPPSLIPAVKVPATFGQNPATNSAVISHDNTATENTSSVPPKDNNFAKNVEIRRISATEEGDKVLESAWDSPEKEKNLGGKTPLQMVQSIISKIEKT